MISVERTGKFVTDLEKVKEEWYARAAQDAATLEAIADALGVTRQTAARRLAKFKISIGGRATGRTAPTVATRSSAD